MFDKIVNFYKEVKRLMDKKYEAQVEICKEVCGTCKDAFKEIIMAKKEGLNKKIEFCKETMFNPKNRSTVGLAFVTVSAGTGILGIGLMLTANKGVV